jgi:hypothetical protein
MMNAGAGVELRFEAYGSDIYLAVRMFAGTMKFSMHKTGEWVSAFTEQSGVVLPETGSRRHTEWQRPPEFTPGWTHGPVVMVPWVSWRESAPVEVREVPG